MDDKEQNLTPIDDDNITTPTDSDITHIEDSDEDNVESNDVPTMGEIDEALALPISDEETAKTKRRKKISLAINISLIVLIVLLVAVLLINKFVITRMTVAGISMQPTLHDGDIVTVHYTKSLTIGDVGVFTRDNKMVVKRVIGVAGDTIKIDADGYVYRNGEKLVENYIKDGMPIFNANQREVTLKEGEYFILGDNRCNSYDSEDYGAITGEHVVGKVLIN